MKIERNKHSHSMTAAAETYYKRRAQEQKEHEEFIAQVRALPDGTQRDPCSRCGVKGSQHAEYGCKRYSPSNLRTHPVASFVSGGHPLS
jgi:hypothetical protein